MFFEKKTHFSRYVENFVCRSALQLLRVNISDSASKTEYTEVLNLAIDSNFL